MNQKIHEETDYQENVQKSKYSVGNYMYGTLTNDTDETIYEIEAVLVLLDDEDNILYIDSENMYNVGLPTGSSITIRSQIPNEFVEYF